jgi:sugar O-acyltransferase (sialic acid O-acetyltransferase NeuD family)
VPEKKGQTVLGYPVLGGDDEVAKYVSSNAEFLITVGQIKSAEVRKKIYNNLVALKAQFATVVSLRAYVSQHAKIGAGTIIMHDALVNAGAVVGAQCIINTKALIEHDAKVSDFCHISTGAIVNGNVTVQESVFLGSQAVTLQGITVEAGKVIPAGSFYRG